MTKEAEKKIEMLLESIGDLLAMGPMIIKTAANGDKKTRTTTLPSVSPKQVIPGGQVKKPKLAPIMAGGK